MKICHEWKHIGYIRATCPYCHEIDTFFNDLTEDGVEGDIIQCKDPRCEKKFKLGEPE
ncbi:unnamed protein product [marine sediment metagenome]|uniref:Uncharacterized protein n=1 Tax=marine sediment metagenome TaxID=412755 RepID=X1J6H6_9ZZZZ